MGVFEFFKKEFDILKASAKCKRGTVEVLEEDVDITSNLGSGDAPDDANDAMLEYVAVDSENKGCRSLIVKLKVDVKNLDLASEVGSQNEESTAAVQNAVAKKDKTNTIPDPAASTAGTKFAIQVCALARNYINDSVISSKSLLVVLPTPSASAKLQATVKCAKSDWLKSDAQTTTSPINFPYRGSKYI